MSETPEWKVRVNHELAQADSARAAGNEGKARVCARRAAGAMIGEYCARQNLTVRSSSAMDRLRYLLAQPDLAPDVREVAEHFLVRIDTDHKLPIDADLIAEVRWLERVLLPDAGQ